MSNITEITDTDTGIVHRFWEPHEGFTYPCTQFTEEEAYAKFHKDWECRAFDPAILDTPDACGRPRTIESILMRAMIRREFPEFKPVEKHDNREI